jgi:hypothetical protein
LLYKRARAAEDGHTHGCAWISGLHGAREHEKYAVAAAASAAAAAAGRRRTRRHIAAPLQRVQATYVDVVPLRNAPPQLRVVTAHPERIEPRACAQRQGSWRLGRCDVQGAVQQRERGMLSPRSSWRP